MQTSVDGPLRREDAADMGAATAIPKMNPAGLLRAMRKLSPEELDDILAQLQRLRVVQRGQTLPEREASCLAAINRTLPSATRVAYRRLEAKRRVGKLTKVEHRELLRLSDELEVLNAARASSLATLATLRRIAVPELMATLGLESLNR